MTGPVGRAGSRGRLRGQYLLLYAVDGCFLPFIPVVLASYHGLNGHEIGAILAVGGLAVMVTPPLVSALADATGRPAVLLGSLLVLMSMALGGTTLATGFWATLVAFAVFSLAGEPAKPLQDSLFFAVRATDEKLAGVPFHRMRIWGTVGYLVPAFVLYWVLGSGVSLVAVLIMSGALSLAAAGNVLSFRSEELRVERPAARTLVRETLAAIHASSAMLTRGHLGVLLAGLFLTQVAGAAYASFFPIYLTETVGLEEKWVGLIPGLGVALELVYMMAFAHLLRALGWRGLLVSGSAAQAVRLALLALWPGVAVVLLTQALHGMVVVATLVGTRVFINAVSDDRIRHGSQGVYTFLVVGIGRAVGSFGAGWFADRSLRAVFAVGAIMSVVAAAIIFRALRPPLSVPLEA